MALVVQHAMRMCHIVICGLRRCRVQLKRDSTRWRTGGEVKGKLANGVGSQYPSLPRNLMYPALLPLMRTPRLPAVDWTDAPADLHGLVRFAERRNLVSARVPSHFKRSLLYFSTLSHKRHVFRKDFLNIKCVLIVSTTFVWNNSHNKKKWARYQQCILVFVYSTHFSSQILLKFEFSLEIFEKKFKYQISWKFF